MEGLKSWFKGRFSPAKSPPPRVRNTGTYRQRLAASEKADDHPSDFPGVKVDPHVHGRVESLGPGKNVFVSSPWIREDLGTHESLKIVDESLLDDDQEAGIDPYNSGKFDKSRHWNQRFRK